MLLEHLKDRLEGKAPKGAKRDPRWPAKRRSFRQRYPTCAVCGTRRKVQIHHIIPFHLAPELELKTSNLIPLCTGGRFKGLHCHLIFGHLGDYQRVNEAVRAVAAEWAVYLNAREYRLRGGD